MLMQVEKILNEFDLILEIEVEMILFCGLIQTSFFFRDFKAR